MKRSKFNLSHYRLMTMDMGDLVPVGLTEVLPGDSFQHSTSALIRVSPLLAPVMHPVHAYIHHWFVPHRHVWEDWEEFITGGDYGSTAPVFPTITIPGAAAAGSHADQLGVPPPGGTDLSVSALPFRAYNLIVNEWYRDQDLQSELAMSTASGVDATTSILGTAGTWAKDYFTLARPWPQKGTAVTIPMSDADVDYVPSTTSTNPFLARNAATDALVNGGDTAMEITATGVLQNAANNINIALDPNGRLSADVSAAAGTIAQLREAFALQRYMEARAMYGSRYTEYLRYLGVRSSDARLQRPEYLGGGKQTIQFSEVLQTGVTTDGDDTEGVGNLKGHGIGALRSNRYRRFFEEHGYVMTLMCVKPIPVYMNGLERHWNRRSKEDFWQKELQFIGQQEVLGKELVVGDVADREATWGYVDRYEEYRRARHYVSGLFRTTYDYWNMARDFSTTLPGLNGAFVTCDPTDRIYAAPEENGQLIMMVNHSLQARRMVAPGGKISP